MLYVLWHVYVCADMYQHMARCHLDLAQLWRCPVSWCTVWKGTPQDCMEHIRGAHDVPGEIKSASLEKYLPPWTVTRQVWTDSLTPRHSGISTYVLLFSDIGLSLVHHYRVHKRGLPHIAFRRNYLSQLRALLPLPAVLPTAGGGGGGARVRCVRRDLPMRWLPRLERPDARSGAGGQSGSWSRLCRMFRSSRCRTRWLRRGQWCSTVAPRCCQCRCECEQLFGRGGGGGVCLV